MTGTFREKDRQINFAIEELEKVKADIMKNSCYLCKDFSGNIQCGKYADIHFCKTKEHIRIIDAHISELKGENNGKMGGNLC